MGGQFEISGIVGGHLRLESCEVRNVRCVGDEVESPVVCAALVVSPVSKGDMSEPASPSSYLQEVFRGPGSR